jgi:hypothetical protein
MSPSYNRRLSELARLLEKAEGELTRSWQHDHLSHKHCDEWCKLWMLLAGSWYSLAWAMESLDEQIPLVDSLPNAHAFAKAFLKSFPVSLTASDINPWFTGYFLISAEHRIANTIDRATTLFFWPQTAPKKIYNRCASLVAACPHSGEAIEAYLPSSHEILRRFAEHPSKVGGLIETWTANSVTGRVYDRVNSIKHKKPDADAVSNLPTAERWRDAVSALNDVASLMRDLTHHWLRDKPR